MNPLIAAIEKEQMRETTPVEVGDTVRVHYRITEGDKTRIQVFEGVVLKKQGAGLNATFTVRKISFQIGVERVFPTHSPLIDKLEIVNQAKVRRAKLYYLRDLRGRAARLKPRGRS